MRGPLRKMGLGFSEPSQFSREQMAKDPDEGAIAPPKKKPKRKPDYIADTESLLEQ